MGSKTSKIRELIAKPRKAYNIRKVLPHWHQLCASMDVIEDTELAIDAFLSIENENDHGKLYLLTYGVLQCLYAQQDAVKNLCEALKIKLDFGKYQSIKQIREIRNESIGHPSKKKAGDVLSFHRIMRVSLDVKGFELLSDHSDGRFETKTVSIYDCIQEQRRHLTEVLKDVVKYLKKEEEEHKMKFKNEKLEDSFGYDVRYHCGSMSESISSPMHHPPEMALADIEMIKKAIENFLNALSKRGISLDTYDSIKYEYEDTKFALKRLEDYFSSLKAGKATITSKDARVYWEFMRNHAVEIIEIAKAIDEEYEDIEE